MQFDFKLHDFSQLDYSKQGSELTCIKTIRQAKKAGVGHGKLSERQHLSKGYWYKLILVPKHCMAVLAIKTSSLNPQAQLLGWLRRPGGGGGGGEGHSPI